MKIRITAGLLSIIIVALLTSCATTSAPPDQVTYRFRGQCYRSPVQASPWTPSPALSGEPEGAALNIATAMQAGDLNQWLASWDASERPQLSPAQQQALLRQWQPLRGCTFQIVDRVIADANVIVELSALDARNQTHLLQFPLTKANDRWWLFNLPPESEFLHWQSSPNKIVEYLDPDAFERRLKGLAPAAQNSDSGQLKPE